MELDSSQVENPPAGRAACLLTERLRHSDQPRNDPVALVRACKADQLKPGQTLRLDLTPPIALFRLDDGFFATEDNCTHAQASLAAGDVDLEECTVECPYHASVFDIRSGRVLSLPANRPLRVYPVKLIDDEVFIEIV